MEKRNQEKTKRNKKVHWRYFRVFYEVWKLNEDDGRFYTGSSSDDPDVIQIAEAENGLLQIWKYMNEEKFFWVVEVAPRRRYGVCSSKQVAATSAAIEYKRLFLAAQRG